VHRIHLFALALLLPFCGGCATSTPPASANVLRVGITPNYPPIIFSENGKPAGMEADFAQALGEALQKRIIFVELPWEEQIPALEANRIDIIMSGMSATDVRARLVAFTDPYLVIGQTLLIRSVDKYKYRYPQVILFSNARIGVEEGTTGDTFVKKNCVTARRVAFTSAREAARALAAKDVDIVVHDTPMIWQLEAEFEQDGLAGVHAPLTQEQLAWAVRRSDNALLADVNRVRREWIAQGRLDEILFRWSPQPAEQ
jgi:ABC-type amino acid transport substrate-binding protein